ncbi:MAG: site-2 protease family protein [Polyangiaceae bacterium]|nr:site-2 protease family protein [Polyangiaceae bacterium]MCE7888159.1 CBS domain-containing protein [Sorangiineae bacterium PRO1]MCL4756106.1 site-2 protease family protein [Myxococcales bacterium]
MSWSFQIARAFGIPIRVHLTFLLIVAWAAFSWGGRHGFHGALFGVISTLALFVSVTLHELGHGVAAQRRGLRVLEIVLLPLGGVAALDGKPARPRDELWIALAGPAVNFALAVVLGGAAVGLHAMGLLDVAKIRGLVPSWSTLLALLVLGNLSLGLFNLLPIFPMDGGRVLRALLAGRFGMARGTRWAAGFGQIAALGMGTFALVNGAFLLALIAVMVFFAAGRERLDATARSALAGLRAGDVARGPSVLLQPGELVGAALRRTLRTSDDVFPVVLGETLVGVVTRDALVFAGRAGRHDDPVAALQTRAWSEVDVNAPVEVVLDELERGQSALAVVLDEGVPVGVIAREHLLSSVLATSAVLGGSRPRLTAEP